MKIIVINGQGGAGKDEFVGFCGYEDEGIYNFSMVDGIKQVAETMGWTGSKLSKDRKFLSDLKDLASEYNDYPFQYTLKEVKEAVKDYRRYHDLSNEFICFIHARELEDIDRWVYDYGARALVIRRPEVEGSFGNHADDNVFEVDYDYEVWNTGSLYQLKEAAENFITKIREEEWESDIWKK
jgi:hypothetical protein